MPLPPIVAILNIGTFELLVLAGGAVLLFGGDLPQTARKAARFVAKIRSMVAELGAELDPPPDLRRPPKFDVGQDEIRSVVADVKRHAPFADEGRIPASVPPDATTPTPDDGGTADVGDAADEAQERPERPSPPGNGGQREGA